MRIAIVGSGISGLVAAHRLAPAHEVTVFEAAPRLGGHTHTVPVTIGERTWNIDTGFIVFNQKTYPLFLGLLRELGVAWQPSDMSFSVRCERTGLEWNGTSLNATFAQRRNLLRPEFLRMLLEILRFNREAKRLLLAPPDDPGPSLGDFLEQGRYQPRFVEHYIVPLSSAVWSGDPRQILRFPVRTLARFFENHGFLQVENRPPWLAVRGGSGAYLEPLSRRFRERIRLASPVRRVLRQPGAVDLVWEDRGNAVHERFDAVVLALHSDQALRLLADPSEAEREVLGAIAYQENEVVLHTDSSLLPRARLARASWNSHLPREPRNHPTVTYWMNRLQSLDAPVDFCVTLNRSDEIDPSQILHRMTYHHPVYDTGAIRAQGRRDEISGAHRIWYCGAYWRYGFHEDGVWSALAVCDGIERWLAGERPGAAAFAPPAGVAA